MKTLFLFPGQMAFCREPTVVSTMLGSCVGVALYDRRLKMGGLNHYLLPEVIGNEKPSPRYGSFALSALIDAALAAGSQKRDLVARVFGGAAVLGDVSIGQKIGEKNVEIALEVLARAGIQVAEQNVRGERGRKIAFNTSTGEVSHSFAGERIENLERDLLESAKSGARPAVEKSAASSLTFKRAEPGPLFVIAVAGNTGAAKSVVKMLSSMTKDCPPLVIAVTGFLNGLAQFLNETSKQTSIDLKLAGFGATLARGTALFIPEGAHGEVRRNGGQFVLDVSAGAPILGQAPSGNKLFSSVATAAGSNGAGVLLSSLGSDGLKGLERLRSVGALTLVEDPKEASYPFVPQLAISEGLASVVVKASDIFHTLQAHQNRRVA